MAEQFNDIRAESMIRPRADDDFDHLRADENIPIATFEDFAAWANTTSTMTSKRKAPAAARCSPAWRWRRCSRSAAPMASANT